MGSLGRSMLNFVRNCQTAFQSSCTILHIQGQWMNSSYAKYLPTRIVVSLKNFKHSNGHVVRAHCSFVFPIKLGKRCWALFRVFIVNLYVCLCKVSAQVYHSYFHWVVRFYYWVTGVFNIFCIEVQFQIYVLPLFSTNLWFCLFLFLVKPFDEQQSLIVSKPYLTYFFYILCRISFDRMCVVLFQNSALFHWITSTELSSNPHASFFWCFQSAGKPITWIFHLWYNIYHY